MRFWEFLCSHWSLRPLVCIPYRRLAARSTTITEQRVPEALSWLELSRRVESIVRSAPALLVVKTDSARNEVSNEITSQIAQLEPFLQRGRSYEKEDEKTATTQVMKLFTDMTENLVSLDELVKKRLSIVALEKKRIRDLFRANNIAQRMLSPGERILGAQMADWNRESGNVRSKAAVKQKKIGPCEFDNSLDSTTKGRASCRLNSQQPPENHRH